jgi:hypothetical protein
MFAFVLWLYPFAPAGGGCAEFVLTVSSVEFAGIVT